MKFIYEQYLILNTSVTETNINWIYNICDCDCNATINGFEWKWKNKKK